jgi:hypothetical protein
MSTTSDDPLDDVLTRAARVTDPELDTGELGAVLDHLPSLLASLDRADVADAPVAASPNASTAGHTTSSSRRSPPRSRRRRLLVVAAGSVGAVAFATPAAADWVSAHTGLFGEPGLTETDTSEWLDAASPEIADIARDLGTQYPLPSGGSYDDAIARLQANGGLVQETGVDNFMAHEAACQWDRAWLAADTAGDAQAANTAVEVLAAVPTWETLVASDGGGVTEHLTEVAAATRRGDRGVVEDHVQANCATEAAPR